MYEPEEIPAIDWYSDGAWNRKGSPLTANNDRIILSARYPFDWMLRDKVRASSGSERSAHMLDACKASGWSHVYCAP